MRGPSSHAVGTIVALVAALATNACSSCDEPTPPTVATCSFSFEPVPGWYGAPITFVAAASDGRAVAAAVTKRPLADAPVDITTVPEPARSIEISQVVGAGLPLTGEAYYLVSYQDPCTGGWFRISYVVDLTPPALIVDPPPGSYFEPVTVTIAADDGLTPVYVRLSRPGSAGEFAPLTTPIELTDSTEYTLDVTATDLAGHAAPATSLTYALDLTSAVVVAGWLGTASRNASPLPAIRLEFDRPMDRTITALTDAVTFIGAAAPPVDLDLYWRADGRALDAVPAERLPQGASVHIDVAGLRSLGGGGLRAGGVTTSIDLLICSECEQRESRVSIATTAHTVTPAQYSVSLDVALDPPPLLNPAGGFALMLVTAGSNSVPVVLPAGDARWSAVDTSGGRYATWAVTFAADLVSAGTLTSVQMRNGSSARFSNALGFVKPATGVAPSVDPVILASDPASGVTSAAAVVIDVQSNVPLDPDGFAAAATLLVNGQAREFTAAPLPPWGRTTLRITPTTPWTTGDNVSLTAPTSVTDIWGRALVSPWTLSFTVSGVGVTAYTATWNRPDGATVFSSETVLLSGEVSPPLSAATVDVIDTETGHRFDAFYADIEPRSDRGQTAHAAARVRIRREPWAPDLPAGRTWAVVLTPVAAAGGASLVAPPARLLVSDPNVESLALTDDEWNGVGALLTRDDGLAPLAMSFAFRSEPVQTTAVATVATPAPLAVTYTKSADPLRLAVPSGADFFAALTAPVLTAAHPSGDQTLNIAVDGVTFSRRIHLLAADSVPSLVSPPSAAVITAAEDGVGFTWTVTEAPELSSVDAWMLILVRDGTNSSLAIRMLPASARSAWLMRDEFPDPLTTDNPADYLWTVLGVRTSGEIPPVLGASGSAWMAPWLGAVGAPLRALQIGY